MNQSRSVAVVVAAAALVVGAVTLTRAGDLEPPAGAVKPTMHSLDEVFTAVGTIQGAAAAVLVVARGFLVTWGRLVQA